MAQKAVDYETRADEVSRPLAKRAVQMATLARAQKKWLRVFDVRYATAGIPIEITDEDIYFPADSTIEVIETGELSKPAANFEVLRFPKSVALQALIHMEISEPSPTGK